MQLSNLLVHRMRILPACHQMVMCGQFYLIILFGKGHTILQQHAHCLQLLVLHRKGGVPANQFQLKGAITQKGQLQQQKW